MLLAVPHGPLTLATVCSYFTLGTQEPSNPETQYLGSQLPGIPHVVSSKGCASAPGEGAGYIISVIHDIHDPLPLPSLEQCPSL